MIKKGLTILSILRWLTILVVVGLIVYAIVIFRHSPEAPAAKMERAMVTDLTQVMELCSMEFVEDLPIRGHIGSKNIFARIKLNGNISFDLDSAKAEIRNDTIYVTLPPERVRVTESTDPDSYQVIDTWNDKRADRGACGRKLQRSPRRGHRPLPRRLPLPPVTIITGLFEYNYNCNSLLFIWRLISISESQLLLLILREECVDVESYYIL